MARVLEFFSGGCPLCLSFQNEVELGKCGPCQVEIIDVRNPEARRRMKKYAVRVVPTLVVDGKIKVEGRINEPWMCGDEFYAMLQEKYPLVNARFTK